MACPQARDSIGKEAECEEFVITIPPEMPRINIPSDLPPAEWPECCIYRVPKQLRKVNEEAYTPKLVSIGPFHHSRKELRDMEMHKLRYFNDFTERTGKKLEDLLKIIKDNEKRIRHCYSEDPLKIIKDNEEKICHCYSEDPLKIIKDNEEKINYCYSEDDFVQMILLDAIFIIELFLKTYKKEKSYILSKPWLRSGILHDLILLENQIPFFVLEKLHMFAFNDSSSCKEGNETEELKEDPQYPKEKEATFVELSLNYFKCYDRQKESLIGEVKHFTDLLRYLFCPPDMERYFLKNIWEQLRRKERVLRSPNKKIEESLRARFCATKLDNAGLKFKEVNEDRRLLDITPSGVLGCFPYFGFSCFMCLLCFPCFMKCSLPLTHPRCIGRPMHILEIPKLVIDDFSEAILRNLMALEQCHYPFQTYICSYVVLFDGLIDTEKDVDLLVDKKVIVNLLGSNAVVATLINNLCDHIIVAPSSYFDYIAQKLNKHCESPLNIIWATLNREYFPNIFRGTATVVGLIVLGFTFWGFLKPFVV